MKGIHQNGKNQDFEKVHPGCLGKIANLFELNIGLSANRLLTDKPHQDGSPLSRSRTTTPRMSPSSNLIEGNSMVPDVKNGICNRKSNGIRMQMLVTQEMYKEVNSRHGASNLVAKLMGLDTHPRQAHDIVIQSSYSRGYPQNLSDSPASYHEQRNGYGDPNECRDFYEIWQQSLKSPHKGRFEETINDKRMILVRQKFIEAKRMSMDKSLRQSKQFQDALEVLSSNKDLFLKCLQEPNSMFHQQSVSPPPGRKRITVLRPSMMADGENLTGAGNGDEKQRKKPGFLQVSGQLERIHPGCPPDASLKYPENSIQPTHIVVLKPSHGKLCDLKAVSPCAEARNEHSSEDVEDENKKSREDEIVAEQFCDGKHHRDETLNSSVLSSGYVGDQSSFDKSEIECADGNLSDSEVMSSASRHSWDYGNRIGSPSTSTFSRVASSPKSSVCREAKKRLSERWAVMALHGSCQEPKHTQRSSITLGEMLALSESKKAASPSEECCSTSQQPRDTNSLFICEARRDGDVDSSPKALLRSKSVPASTEFGTKLHTGISSSNKEKPEFANEELKTSVKSSFKGKVSSLFFSRNRKPGKEIYVVAEAKNEGHSFPGETCRDRTGNLGGELSNIATPGLWESSSKASSCSLTGNHGMMSPQAGLAEAQPIASGNPHENKDQPSPISALDLPFDGYEHIIVFPQYRDSNQHGVEPSLHSSGSNLIDKSPLIGSLARTRSWDNSCVDATSSQLARETLPYQETYEEKKEWFLFIKTLLSEAGLDGEVQSNSLSAGWHSPDSPLDPSLRDKYVDTKDKEALCEAEYRQKQLTPKLVFDCVNEALVEIAGDGSGKANNGVQEGRSSSLVNEVWARINGMIAGEIRCALDVCEDDDNCLMVVRVVRNEVAGKAWINHLRLEMDNLGKELEEELVEELVQEAMVNLIGRA